MKAVPRFWKTALLAGVLTPLFGCEVTVEVAREYFRTPLYPHEEYRAHLIESGLSGTAMGRDWVAAAAEALEAAPPIKSPFREEGILLASEVMARSWRVELIQGQVLRVEVAWEGGEPGRVFVDLFELSDREALPRHRVSARQVPDPEGGSELEFEPRDDGTFLVRLQPELLRGGSYTVTIRTQASLAFPVEGRDVGAIQSFFGAERDGGRRSHHGVDIFAPRGTPVLAAADAVVRRVEVTNRGGKVVWLRDSERRQALYYAHLDSQYVSEGQRVAVGDTVGFVGNSGNARTTPPHLHFGIYSRGPQDPFPALNRLPQEPAERTEELTRIGEWVRVRTAGIRLREGAGRSTPVAVELDPDTPLEVLAIAGGWYRVRTPRGGQGFVASRLTRPATERIAGSRVVEEGAAVRARPDRSAPAVARIAGTAEFPVLGRFEGYELVEFEEGRSGWLQVDEGASRSDSEE